MNDIERKALEMINAEIDYDPTANDAHEYKALCRAIEQHEAFRHEVSGAAQEYEEAGYPMAWEGFEQFILPAPKPDPLVEAMADCGVDRFESWADQLRAALEARGLTITTVEKD